MFRDNPRFPSAGPTRAAFLGSCTAFAALPRVARAEKPTVSVAYAGSLVTPMEHAIGPAFAARGFSYRGEAKGSTAIANLIRGGLRTPDVFISADTAAIRSLLGNAGNDSARWYATFAATRMTIAYAPYGPHAAAFADAARGATPWYELLARDGVRVARTDPAQDPKGYRVLLVMQLAQTFYRRPDLSARVLGAPDNPAQILPEEDALARLESGEIDGVWAYANEAVGRNLPVIPLPPQIDLGDPAFAADYARAHVTVGGKTYTGTPSVYALTVPTHASDPAAGAAFVAFLLGPDGSKLLTTAGLTVVRPTVGGDRGALPASLRELLDPAPTPG